MTAPQFSLRSLFYLTAAAACVCLAWRYFGAAPTFITLAVLVATCYVSAKPPWLLFRNFCFLFCGLTMLGMTYGLVRPLVHAPSSRLELDKLEQAVSLPVFLIVLPLALACLVSVWRHLPR